MQWINNRVAAMRVDGVIGHGVIWHGVIWRKSRHSNPSGNCVEVAELADGRIAVRNSRYPSGPALIYSRAEMAAFVEGAKLSEFDA